MSRSTRKRYRDPEREEFIKIKFTGYELEELFGSDEVADLIAIAKRRVAGEFHYAKELRSNGREYRTDNYILGLGGRLSDLARYVARETRKTVVKKQDLPADLQSLAPSLVDCLINQANYDLIVEAVQLMHYQEVWYDEALGIWQICQSSMDRYWEEERASRHRPATKHDQRPFHGRVRRQSRDRGIAPGVSVGLA